VETVRAAVAYDEVARRFLLRAKIGLRRELMPTLALQLCSLVRRWVPARSCTEIVPIPSHPWTDLRRGFSPAGELARPLARLLGVPLRRGRIRRRLFGGIRAKRLGARKRMVLARESFRASGEIPGSRILLVDDVMTTGATIEACARALRQAGADEVRAVVWARTLPSDRTSAHVVANGLRY
jgi:predicted amidophosphoribosyltransferase